MAGGRPFACVYSTAVGRDLRTALLLGLGHQRIGWFDDETARLLVHQQVFFFDANRERRLFDTHPLPPSKTGLGRYTLIVQVLPPGNRRNDPVHHLGNFGYTLVIVNKSLPDLYTDIGKSDIFVMMVDL